MRELHALSVELADALIAVLSGPGPSGQGIASLTQELYRISAMANKLRFELELLTTGDIEPDQLIEQGMLEPTAKKVWVKRSNEGGLPT